MVIPMYDGGSDERPTSLSLHRQQSQRSARLLQAASNSSPLLAQLFSHTTKACGGTYSAAAATYLMMRCGLRPFALPRSLIPPKSHAALVSFNQQHQPSKLGSQVNSSPTSTIAVAAAAGFEPPTAAPPSCEATMVDAMLVL